MADLSRHRSGTFLRWSTHLGKTRIYAYSASGQQLGIRGVRGEVVMQVNGNPTPFRYPIKEAADAKGGVYGSVAVDVTRVRDGDMQVMFRLAGLPLKGEGNAQFKQTFALTRPPIQVAVARIAETDRPLIKRQRLCPVMNEELGAHGEVIKLVVGNQSLFVCCESCIEEVQKHPHEYVRKVAAVSQPSHVPPKPQVSVLWAAPTDDSAIRAQRICPVMNEPLGGHGRPIKVVIDGRPIFVCCQGCVEEVVHNRNLYFRKVADATASRQAVPPGQQAPARENVSVGYATAADRSAVLAQGLCPVMKQPLGGHGTPIKISIDGRAVFVCCKGCVSKVEQNPDLYLSKVVHREHASTHSRKKRLAVSKSATSHRRYWWVLLQ